MIKSMDQQQAGIFSHISKFEQEHPYVFSFILSLIFLSYILFYSPSLDITEENLTPVENIQFIDIDRIDSPKRIVKKQVAKEEGNIDESEPIVERAVGTSEDTNAVDIAFFPNIAPPKPIGKLKKRYPKIAREMNIEAVINIELLIAANGKVKNVNVLGIRLSKALPPEMHGKIAKEFSRDALKILLGAQFTPPIVNGKNVAIKMEMPLRFRLN
ncbi:MAG: energy transducer TonB [Spirochaetota bacterium]|nr:energy transducer TonB [Spirochaetota bacterium]